MRGFLGEKIDGGASADIHIWAPGQIVKLFKAGVPERFGRHEARMTRAAFAAGAPEVFDEMSVDGRFGIVLRRLDGPTLQQLLLTSAMTPEQVGAILASLYISVHKRRRRRMSPCSAVGSISHHRPPATYCRSTLPPAS
jgi:hypothetical protein